jgi:hypothetical protein
MSMDITNISTSPSINTNIALILDQIAPFYDPATASTGTAIDGTILYLHTTSLSVTNGNTTITSANITKTYDNALSTDGSSTVTAITDVSFSPIPGPAATVAVTRQNKRFIMGRTVSGRWGFDGDF